MQFHLAVKGIIRNEAGEILVVKRSAADDHKPGVWETPGGGIDREESPQEALAREIKEETGLSVSVGEPFNVFTFRKNTGEFKVGITFLCNYQGGDVVLSEEHDEYRWLRPEMFQYLPSVPSLQKEIRLYYKQYE
jgi:8-oxo-dGTP diphosphatase